MFSFSELLINYEITWCKSNFFSNFSFIKKIKLNYNICLLFRAVIIQKYQEEKSVASPPQSTVKLPARILSAHKKPSVTSLACFNYSKNIIAFSNIWHFWWSKFTNWNLQILVILSNTKYVRLTEIPGKKHGWLKR